ncbi:WXG100 family type VII secretion target [Segniliparus rugosus]|uniref:ESAT-6-like protein n=1 Tax=Segniliparus rugosus (strain ATCC BAA-974 / DSM 45345 / CCUG 50838 / CIP 108380 / JCM 13579 / CDC 945) TaxID=679197 RepID=E5XKN6_SEGRC|nr:WXG100 family type VII secretion target [Segniliparus rugosus]EFV15083.1 WXG100 family type VII secretion target [Segniliparus rugosus ATCC BAA-974]
MAAVNLQDATILSQAASSFEEHHQQYNALNAQLQGLVDDAQGQWRGAAAGSFATSANKWHEASAAIAQILNDIQENLQSSGVDYERVEEEQAAALDLHW